VGESAEKIVEEKTAPDNKRLTVGLVVSFLIIISLLIYILVFPVKKEVEMSPEETTQEEVVEEADVMEEETLGATDEEEVVVGETFPDLYIEEYSFDSEPKQNEEFTVRIEIGNQGNASAKDFHWEWWATDGGKDCGEEVVELKAGDTMEVECDYTYTDEDTFDTKVILDPEEDIDESDEDNNVVEEEVDVLPKDKADLVISEYSFDPVPERNVSFTVRIGIKNQGDAPANAFWWEWWPSDAAYNCREKISTLAANSVKVVTCDYLYSNWGTYNTKVIVDVDDEVEELDKTNNEHAEDVFIPITIIPMPIPLP
jgi:subtilase family serine protease